MKIFLILLALILSVILQTTLISFLTFLGTGPNLVLVLVLVLVVWQKFDKVWWLIVLTGLLLDLLIGLPLGLASLSLVTTAYLIDRFNQSIFSGVKFWITGFLVILGTLIYTIILLILTKVFQVDMAFKLLSLFIGVSYNFLISLVIYAGAKKIFS